MDFSNRIETLNRLAAAFAQRCYRTVATSGAKAQSEYRYKTFSVTRETASIFLPDGTLTEYVLESYERGFLGVLLAASYLNLQKTEEAKVELRRLDHELFAPLYNYGEDPVNLLLSAVMWERLGELAEARVDWLRLRDVRSPFHDPDEAVRSFAAQQVERIDHGTPAALPWHLYAVGTFPEVQWDLQFTGSTNGYFSVWPARPFTTPCMSETGARLSTQSWFEKLAVRHSHAYHPLLHLQSWIRLPIGVTYSLVPVAAGAALAVGGCVADASLSSHRGGSLCEVSVRSGTVLMSQAPKVLKWALEPDLRHWERIPATFVMTRATDLSQEPCARAAGLVEKII